MMFIADSRSRALPGASPSLRKVTIPHCSTPRSCTLRSERFDPCLDRVDAEPHRVAGGDAKADLAGDEALPVFEPARVAADDIGVAVSPGGGLKIEEGRFEHADRVAPHLEEGRAAGPMEILAARAIWP